MSGTPPRLYTYTETAEQLKMSEVWLRREVRARRVTFVRMGRSVRFSDDDITAIIATRTQAVLRKAGGQRNTHL